MSRLFQESRIGNLLLKNRLIMAPMTTNFASPEGLVTERLKAYYRKRAEGGIGLVIVEMACVDYPAGRAFSHQLSIDDDKFIPGLRELAREVKAAGAKVALQLQHSGRQTSSRISGSQPVAPSPIPSKVKGETPRELREGEILALAGKFIEATRRAREAEFDALELHCAHGYLLCQFLSPYSNRRQDRWGGDIEGRTRFIQEIVKGIRRELGGQFPLLARISAEEWVEGGLTLRETKEIAKKMQQWGVDALHISGGNYDSALPLMTAPMGYPDGCLLPLAEEVKKVVFIPVIAVGRLDDRGIAEGALAEGKADFIALGRGLIADPQLPGKWKVGREDEVLPCIRCNRGCLDEIVYEGGGIKCLVNPEVGREMEGFPREAVKPKKVLVVGGGPAGMEAAIIAARRKHQVVLLEKEGALGGQLRLASIPPYKGELIKLLSYFEGELSRRGVEVRFGVEALPELIVNLKPEALVLATGAKPLIPDIPGVAQAQTAWEVLLGKEVGERTIVIGGGQVGCEVAEFLAQKGKRVTILETTDKIGGGIGLSTRWLVMRRLREAQVTLLTSVQVLEIKRVGVKIKRNGQELWIDGDSIVLAMGSVSCRELAEALEGKLPELHIVGDCQTPRTAMEAIEEGYIAGCEV